MTDNARYRLASKLTEHDVVGFVENYSSKTRIDLDHATFECAFVSVDSDGTATVDLMPIDRTEDRTTIEIRGRFSILYAAVEAALAA
jgi:hypothetical protein